jgi:hypothetical protein
MKQLLVAFSYIFHPLFTATYGSIFYFAFAKEYFQKEVIYLLLSQIVIITLLIPLALFYLLKTLKKVDNWMIPEVTQRRIPLLIQILLLSVLLLKTITPYHTIGLYYFFLAGIISSSIAFSLTFFKIKISLHQLGIASLTSFAIGLSLYAQYNIINTIAFLVAINGFIASSRLVMQAHSLREIGYGFICGCLPQISLWYFWVF